MRILILHPNASNAYSWQLGTFREEVGRQHDAVYYGAGYQNRGEFNVPAIVEQLGPFDCILLGDYKYCGQYYGLDEIKNSIKVVSVTDYFPRNFAPVNNFINLHKPHLVLFKNTLTLNSFEKFKTTGAIDSSIKGQILPFSVDTKRFRDYFLVRDIDISAVFALVSWAYPKRAPLQQELREMEREFQIVMNDGGRLSPRDYIQLLARTKLFVSVNGQYNCMTMKYLECLASGVLFLTDKPVDFERMGFKGGQHMVLYKDFDQMERQVRHYLGNKEERLRIAEAGKRFVRANHSDEFRVKEFTTIVEGML